MSEEELEKEIQKYIKHYDIYEQNKRLQQENKQLKDLYKKTCEHLFNIGNDELARYFQAQIIECPIFTTQKVGDDKV